MKKNKLHRIKQKSLLRLSLMVLPICTAGVGSVAFAKNDGALYYKDIAANNGAGITYRRMKSPSDLLWDALKQKPVYMLEDMVLTPGKSKGAPGVAIFDFDKDGDLDMYVTNGPGRANSLYSNQTREGGKTTFKDVSDQAGVALTTEDSTGVCFGDINNDGYQELYVLSNGGVNHLFLNKGDGTFTDISDASGTAAGGKHPSGCAMGDINNDGLLDIAVGNSYDNWTHRLPLQRFGYEDLMEKNQLFLNKGDDNFVDVSESSGIANNRSITWGIGLVDYDNDGDVDLLTANDQGPKPPLKYGGQDEGVIRIYKNDGTGQFTDATEISGAASGFGAWMGISFGDINNDGYLDIFGTNVGDYLARLMTAMVGFNDEGGEWSSRWLLGHADGKFTSPGVGRLGTTPFGWGTSMADYDNDADTDIIFFGSLDMGPFQDASNPGAILKNDGTGEFDRDAFAFSKSTNHSRRDVQGSAVGDLNDDGFIDIVSVSADDWPDQFPLAPFVAPQDKFGGQFDDAAYIWPTFTPVDPQDPKKGFTWNHMDPVDGTLSVGISSANNGNKWVKVNLVGTKGLVSSGQVNRDGMGANILFQPYKGKTVMKPVLGGGSHASNDATESVFGLGKSRGGVIEVRWPGGVKNRLYDVKAGERINFPEISCNIDASIKQLKKYERCVKGNLNDLEAVGIITKKEKNRFMASAMRGFKEVHGLGH
ncbi:MAG: CRTAC1 family protein [Methylovulum sp.]|nr:CRTAC1 family protein [Methylovulum sp.]